MKPSDIQPGRSYIGGKNGVSRTVVSYGSSQNWVCWAPTSERLPLGGFTTTTCTSRANFARWAKSEAKEG